MEYRRRVSSWVKILLICSYCKGITDASTFSGSGMTTDADSTTAIDVTTFTAVSTETETASEYSGFGTTVTEISTQSASSPGTSTPSASDNVTEITTGGPTAETTPALTSAEGSNTTFPTVQSPTAAGTTIPFTTVNTTLVATSSTTTFYATQNTTQIGTGETDHTAEYSGYDTTVPRLSTQPDTSTGITTFNATQNTTGIGTSETYHTTEYPEIDTTVTGLSTQSDTSTETTFAPTTSSNITGSTTYIVTSTPQLTTDEDFSTPFTATDTTITEISTQSDSFSETYNTTEYPEIDTTVTGLSTQSDTSTETTFAPTTSSNITGSTTFIVTSTPQLTTDDTTTTPSPTTAAPTCAATCEDTCRENYTCSCISDICTEVCPQCGNNSECVDLQCRCEFGYEAPLGGDQTNCVDINDCDTNQTCTGNGQSCVNLPGTYECTCILGYIREADGTCTENRCSSENCGDNAGCYDSATECSCVPGYSGDPSQQCSDIDECLQPVPVCTDAERCVNTVGSYICDCIAGYTKSSEGLCVPIECPIVAIQCDTLPSGLCYSANITGLTNVTFPETLGGFTTTSDTTCGSGTTNDGIPLGSRACNLDGSWAAVTWLQSCGEGLSAIATQPIDTEEQRQSVSANLQILTSDPQNIDSTDVMSTTQAIASVTNTTNITTTTATSVVSTISNVMESPGLSSSGQASQLLTQLDIVASLVTLDNEEPYFAVNNNISMVVTQSNPALGGVSLQMFVRPNTSSIGFRSDQFSTTSSNSSVSSGSVVDGQRVQSAIFIPQMALEKSSKSSFYVFGNNKLFASNDASGEAVSDIVISATVENQSISNLAVGNRLTYSLPLPNNRENKAISCEFWNESTNEWSGSGCFLTNSSEATVSCECDHLTNFAALLRPLDLPAAKALNVITIVGCSISTCALLILVMIFLCVPKTRSGRKFQAAFLLVNLSLALLGLNVTLLISEMPFIANPANYDDIASSCIAIAAILHFFLLASCAWMNCEASTLCMAVVKPLWARTRLRNQKLVWASVAWGWAMPAIFVGIVAISDYSLYEYPYDQGATVTCWIQPNYIIYLAVIPTAIMISGNLIAYVVLSYHLCRNRESGWGKSWRATRQSQKRKLGINLSIVTLLGLTWVFGFFLAGIADETTALVFAYIFTVLNSLQGFFLLILYVMRNNEARLTVRRELSTIYDKLGFGSSKESKRSRESTMRTTAYGSAFQPSIEFTDIRSSPHPSRTEHANSIGDVSPDASIRKRSRNEYGADVVTDWRTIKNIDAQ